MKKTLTKRKAQRNPLESLLDLSLDVVGTMAQDTKDQVFGLQENERKTKGDLAEGQELNLSKMQEEEKEEPKLDIDPGINYRREIIHTEEQISVENTKELSVKIQEILIEIKQLVNCSQELQVEFKEIAAEPRIVNPGKYHVSFFEWVLLIVRQARMKVEDSEAWLAAFNSKKAKKGYWGMFKKHGTSFGMSNERVVATQTG